MNKFLLIFSPYEENPLRCCNWLRVEVPLVQQSRQLNGLSLGQQPKCMTFPTICYFGTELHQKIQSKSVTIFHPLAIHTHTRTNKGHYVQILIFIGKSYRRASLTWFHLIKRKMTRFKGISFFLWEFFQVDSPGRPECQKLRSFNMQQVTFSLYSADKLILKTDIFAIFRVSVNVVH